MIYNTFNEALGFWKVKIKSCVTLFRKFHYTVSQGIEKG